MELRLSRRVRRTARRNGGAIGQHKSIKRRERHVNSIRYRQRMRGSCSPSTLWRSDELGDCFASIKEKLGHHAYRPGRRNAPQPYESPENRMPQVRAQAGATTEPTKSERSRQRPGGGAPLREQVRPLLDDGRIAMALRLLIAWDRLAAALSLPRATCRACKGAQPWIREELKAESNTSKATA